jgi:hypothetical protein
MAIELYKSVEIVWATADPGNGDCWAPPLAQVGPKGQLFPLGVGRRVNAAWWIPATAFAALSNFAQIGLEVEEDDVYLSLIGVDKPSGSKVLDILIFIDG